MTQAQFSVPLDGIDVHFIHVQSKGLNPLSVLLFHGWPGSVLEFLEVIPRLTDPARFGGDPADAVTIVAPFPPGYAFSFKHGQKRYGIEVIADVFAILMTDVQRKAAIGLHLSRPSCATPIATGSSEFT